MSVGGTHKFQMLGQFWNPQEISCSKLTLDVIFDWVFLTLDYKSWRRLYYEDDNERCQIKKNFTDYIFFSNLWKHYILSFGML